MQARERCRHRVMRGNLIYRQHEKCTNTQSFPRVAPVHVSLMSIKSPENSIWQDHAYYKNTGTSDVLLQFAVFFFFPCMNNNPQVLPV